MAISTYSELQTALTSYLLHGAAVTTAQIQDFIALCESELNATLRTRWQEAEATLTPVSGEASLPADFLEVRNVVALSSPRSRLELVTPDYAESVYSTRYEGIPKHYTIVGSTMTFFPTPSVDVELHYYEKIDALSDSATTNWVLTNFPLVYLFGSLKQAALGNTANDERGANWTAAYMAALNDLRSADRRARYSRGSARISGPTP